jgi:hypothetical protein
LFSLRIGAISRKRHSEAYEKKRRQQNSDASALIHETDLLNTDGVIMIMSRLHTVATANSSQRKSRL